MIQSFFLRGSLVAQQPAKPEIIHAQLSQPFGKAFFCPHCSEIWAIAVVENRDTFCEHIPCELHPPTPSFPLQGSLWLSWNENWNKNLPQPLLEREFLLLTKEI